MQDQSSEKTIGNIRLHLSYSPSHNSIKDCYLGSITLFSNPPSAKEQSIILVHNTVMRETFRDLFTHQDDQEFALSLISTLEKTHNGVNTDYELFSFILSLAETAKLDETIIADYQEKLKNTPEAREAAALQYRQGQPRYNFNFDFTEGRKHSRDSNDSNDNLASGIKRLAL